MSSAIADVLKDPEFVRAFQAYMRGVWDEQLKGPSAWPGRRPIVPLPRVPKRYRVKGRP